MTTYYSLDAIKILLYRSPAGSGSYKEQTISIGDTTEDQITEDDATQLANDAQSEVLPQIDAIAGYTTQITYAVNRIATANILNAVYSDIIAEDNPRWQYAKKLEKQANNMITVINKKDDKEAGLPKGENKTTDPVFSITENTKNANMDRDYNPRT